MLSILEEISKRVQSVEDGNVSALDVYAQLVTLSKECELAKEQILESVKGEAEMYSEKTFSKNGYEFTKIPAKGRYDYKGDTEWAEIKEKLDTRQQLMKDAHKTTGIIVDEDGEVVNPAIYKATKTSISIKKID